MFIKRDFLLDTGRVNIEIIAETGPTLKNGKVMPNINKDRWEGTFSVMTKGIRGIVLKMKGNIKKKKLLKNKS